MNDITIKFDHHGYQSEKYILDKVKRAIEKYNNDGMQSVKDLIELSLKTKTLITLVKNQHRGFGKTTEIAKKAHELGAVLIVPYKSMEKDLKMKGYYVRYFNSPHSCRGVRLEGGFLVDEGVDSDVIRELVRQGNEFLGGFARL